MGIPIHRGAAVSHVFVRTYGTLDTSASPEFEDVAACSHYDMDGRLVTEALLSGAAADEACIRRMFPDAFVTSVRHYDWVRESILEASGRADRTLTPNGMLAVHALRADDDELHLVEHPRALSGSAVLMHVARMLDW